MRFRNKREKLIAIVALTALGLLLLDQVVITPLMHSQTLLEKDIAVAQEQHDKDERILNKSMVQDQRWRGQVRSAIPADASIAEKKLMDNLQQWSQESNMVITVMGSPRSEKEKELLRISRPVTVTGNMEQLRSFLWQIQKAEFPVRILDISIISKPEGTDNLTATLNLGTLARLPETPAGMGQNKGNGQEKAQ